MKLFKFGIVVLFTFFLGNLAAFACPLHSGGDKPAHDQNGQAQAGA